jgi:hypothetical protein
VTTEGAYPLVRKRRLPPWADEWMDGTCRCGARLVKVYDYTGAEHAVCAVSGWDNFMCERPCEIGQGVHHE